MNYILLLLKNMAAYISFKKVFTLHHFQIHRTKYSKNCYFFKNSNKYIYSLFRVTCYVEKSLVN